MDTASLLLAARLIDQSVGTGCDAGRARRTCRGSKVPVYTSWMSAPTCIQSDHMAKARLTVPSQPIALPGSPKADEA
jgi:hypothetical protein